MCFDVCPSAEQLGRYSEQLVLFDSITVSILPVLLPDGLADDGDENVALGDRHRGTEILGVRDGTDDRVIEGWYALWSRPFLFPRFVKADGANDTSTNGGASTGDPWRFYGCFQSLMKMHPSFDQAIAKVCLREGRCSPSAAPYDYFDWAMRCVGIACGYNCPPLCPTPPIYLQRLQSSSVFTLFFWNRYWRVIREHWSSSCATQSRRKIRQADTWAISETSDPYSIKAYQLN